MKILPFERRQTTPQEVVVSPRILSTIFEALSEAIQVEKEEDTELMEGLHDVLKTYSNDDPELFWALVQFREQGRFSRKDHICIYVFFIAYQKLYGNDARIASLRQEIMVGNISKTTLEAIGSLPFPSPLVQYFFQFVKKE